MVGSFLIKTNTSLHTTLQQRQYLESEPETRVRQQMNAALHNIFSDAEVGGKLCFHIWTTNIFNILTLRGRRDLCRESDS